MLSPSTYRLNRVKKLRAYAREKVAYAWLVNPTERTLEILRLQGGQWVIVATHGGDAIVRAGPFEAVAIDLLELWGRDASAEEPALPSQEEAHPQGAPSSSPDRTLRD